MSSLGSLLLQPQSLTRMQALNRQQAFGDDTVALIRQILVNPEYVESVAPAFQRAFEGMGERLRVRLEPRLQQALDELGRLVAPLTDRLTRIGTEAGNIATVGEALDVVGEVLEALVAGLESLSETQVRDLARRVFSILTDTLGLNQTVLKDELREVFRAIRAELLSNVATIDPQKANIHLALAALIGRMENELLAQFPALDLNPDRITQEIMLALRRSGFEKIRAQIACILGKVRAALGATGALIDLASPSPFGPGSVGAAAARPPLSGDTYAWYASWLYATRRREAPSGAWFAGFVPGFPDDEVWLSEDRKQLILRRAAADDEVLHESTGRPLDAWYQAPQFTTASSPECFTFGTFSPEFMETWTRVWATLAEWGKGVGHILSFETSPRDYAANIPLWLWYWTRGMAMILAGAPLQSFLNNRARWGVGSEWLYVWVAWLSVILGSLEGKHSKTTGGNSFKFWVTLLGGDAINALTIYGIAGYAYEIPVSLFTLINQTGPAGAGSGTDTRPRNREQGTPFISLAVTGANWLFNKYIVPRNDYTYPFNGDNPRFWLYLLVGAPLAGVTGATGGTLLVWLFSRTFDWVQLGKDIGFAALRSALTFILTEYSTKENDSDGGKYNPLIDREGNAYAPARVPFGGYPAESTSPYKLPYAKDVALYVSQGNMGMFSHHRFNNLPQIYSYDFGHDFGDEILAARGGTVVDYFDWIPDDIDPTGQQITDAITAAGSSLITGQTGQSRTNFSWNFIMIRHDTASAEHDKDAGGGQVTTFGVYGHGKLGSVRELFAARGVTDPKNIIGQIIQQGQPIMRAGDTGFSFHNHLHMHVQGSVAGTPAAPPITSDQLTQYTLPFVFHGVKHTFGPDGVLKSLTWYKSDNERIP